MSGILKTFLMQAEMEYGLNCLACEDFSLCPVMVDKTVKERCTKNNLSTSHKKEGS